LGKILVADDDQDRRELIIFSLRFAGYIVLGATSGEEYVRVAKMLKPDLILMDVGLLNMNGESACKALKKNDDTDAIPMILISEPGDYPDSKTGVEDCVVDVIVRPIEPDELTKKVNLFLKGAGS
jgi:DNA-binding response OmpR family regulator